MIDTSWLLWSRVLFHYASHAIASKIAHAIIGLVSALAVGTLLVIAGIGGYTILTSLINL